MVIQIRKTYNKVVNKINRLTKKDIYRFKKTPVGDKYSYVLNDSFAIFGEDNVYSKFYLVGKNWTENRSLPIAIVIGCNDWKFGFISDYLIDYRLAFLPIKDIGLNAIQKIFRLNVKPSRIFIWSYKESKVLSFYLYNLKNIPISRIEDAFVRSCELGASHSTPYSLVVDNKGLYFNSYNESDLEYLLNNYEIDSSTDFINKSNELLNLLINEGFSKYNPAVSNKFFKIKTKKYIAILGQIDSDASIKYGNPDNWNADELILLAREENPEAEIFYRPHPEIFKGYQKSKFSEKNIEAFQNINITNPDDNFSDFIERIDHVYTISSLTGFEALLRGKEVTVVGVPFYAGWGLTDDRCSKNLYRRNRNRTLIELFSITYLIYPKYLANLDDSYKGLFAAFVRIKADRQLIENDYFQEKVYSDEDDIKELVSSKYFVKLLFSTNHVDKALKKFSKINFNFYLNIESSYLFQKIFVLSVFGRLQKKDTLEDEFLSKVRSRISCELFHELLLLIYKYANGKVFIGQLLWFKQQYNDFEMDNIFLEKIDQFQMLNKSNLKDLYNINISQNDFSDNISTFFTEQRFDQLVNLKNIFNDLDNSEIFSIIKEPFSQFIYQKNKRNFDKAFEIATYMMINGIETNKILIELADYSRLLFDFPAAIEIAQLMQNINLFTNKSNMSTFEMATYGSKHIQDVGELNITFNMAKVLVLRPNIIPLVPFIVNKYINYDPQITYEILESTLYLDNEQSIAKAQAFTSIAKPDIALNILRNVMNQFPGNLSVGFIIAYCQALSFNNQLDEALSTIDQALIRFPFKTILMEGIRLNIINNNYIKCMEIINISFKHNIQLGDMYYRKVYFGIREINKAFKTFLDTPVRENFIRYYSNKYLDLYKDLSDFSNILLLSIFGPGDEIRFSSIYSNVIKFFPNIDINITCSHKLNKILSRSFPDIRFIPSDRLRKTDFDYSSELMEKQYSHVKGYDVMNIMDNNAAKAIENSDKVALVTDFLSKFILDYSSFNGVSYFVEDDERVREFKEILPAKSPLIGLSWRSSLATFSRNEHYLSIQELEPLFKIKDLTFVNFQYDECSEELAWVEENYPGKLINIEQLDQLDDLDGVAAMLKCMDLVISPATTVVELSGALGCNTWLFSNSSEIDWRKKDASGTDAWHDSVTIVDVDEKGNKELLVEEIYNKLIKFSSKFK